MAGGIKKRRIKIRSAYKMRRNLRLENREFMAKVVSLVCRGSEDLEWFEILSTSPLKGSVCAHFKIRAWGKCDYSFFIRPSEFDQCNLSFSFYDYQDSTWICVPFYLTPDEIQGEILQIILNRKKLVA